MSEDEAKLDLRDRGIWRMAPGLWCDQTVPDLIGVHDVSDNAVCVRNALDKAGMLPPLK